MICEVYTDGCCLGNPGPGGYGIVIIFNGKEEEYSGGEKETTNNRMEMKGVISALEIAEKRSKKIKLYTDSKYIVDGITSWIKNWKKKNWKTRTGTPVKNKELWEKIDNFNNSLDIEWVWIKGHEENPYNNRCDFLAKSAAKKYVK